MRMIKEMIKGVLGVSMSQRLYEKVMRFKKSLKVINLNALIINTFIDGKLYYKHSMVFKQNTFNKIESRIVLHYHGLEKGFLHTNFRYRFAEARIKELIKLLNLEEVIENNKKSQIAAAYLSMCRYYERHKDNKVDISDFFKREDYELFKSLTVLDLDIIEEHFRNSYFENTFKDFKEFSNSRASIRSFTGEKITFEIIEKVIELAKNAPSVCNRQPTKVYYIENKEKIDKVLQIQGGLTGYTDDISQLLIVVTDRNYFYSIGERNQLYVDGGIFVMNLLYALHYYKIGACPAHWGHTSGKDKDIMKEISLSESEKVICVIPIGIPKDKFKTTLSLRRGNNEILKIV